jgi:hypothetical protein
MTMIAKAIGRWRARLPWKSTKSAVAPPTSTVAPGGARIARIRLTVDLLASELKGLAEIARIATTPPCSCSGGATAVTPGVRRIRAASWTSAFGVAPLTETQIGVSR